MDFTECNFDQIKISMKSFEVDITINAYKELAKLVMYPFHIGITESGSAVFLDIIGRVELTVVIRGV